MEPSAGTRSDTISFLGIDLPDTAPAAAFFGQLFGWKFEQAPPGYAEGFLVTESLPVLTGLRPSDGKVAFTPSFQVSDVEATVARVRELGGTATEPEAKPHGRVSFCEYAGLGFYVGQPPS